MSPRKRRGPTPRRTTPAVQALKDAQVLTDPAATRLAAELWASRHLGQGWADAPVEVEEPEREVLAQVVAEAVRRASPSSVAALAACRLLVEDPAVEQALAGFGHEPRWAQAPRPEPVRAWRSSDPWRSRDAWFLDFGDHVLLASARHPRGTRVEELVVMGPSSLAEFDRMAAQEDLIGERVEVPVAEAVREVLAALEWTELTLPREPSRSFAELRLLVRARLAGLPTDEEDVPGFPDEVRAQLRADFLGDGASRPEQRLTDLFLDHGGALHDPLRWSPEDVEVLLLDRLAGDVVLDEAERAALPALLERWVVFALSRAGIEPRWQEPVVAAVRERTGAVAP